MNSLNKIITFILLSLFLSSGILFAQGGAQKEGTLRDGAEIGAITELDIHTNIETVKPQNFKLPGSYLFDFDFDGIEHEYPFNETENLYDIEKIFSYIEN